MRVLVPLLVLLLPGLALSAALMPSWRPGGLERLAMSVALSLVLLVLLAALVAATPWDFEAGLAAALGGVTLLVTAVAFVRRETGESARTARPWRPRSAPTRGAIALWVAAGALGAGAVVLAVEGARRADGPHFSEFAASSGPGAARVEVRNREGSRRRYRMELVAGARVVEAWPVRLDAGARWAVTVRLPEQVDERVTARLYRLDRPARSYRELTLR